MNGARVVPAAEERLLDAALAQVLAGRRHDAAPAPGPAPWLAAALVMLGVLVTAATMWLARAPERDAAQQPEPLPPQVRADGRAELDALPADTRNLSAGVMSSADLDALVRLRSLRSLVLHPLSVRVGPVDTRQKLPVWKEPPADLFAPLTKLPALASLGISGIATPPPVLAALSGCRALRELSLGGPDLRVDDAFAQALAAIPTLRSLRFELATVDAAAIRRLQPLPLASLHLSYAFGFDSAAWTALVADDSLEALSFASFGRTDPQRSTKDTIVEMWRPSTAELRMLDQLPKLRSLSIRACAFGDEDLAALPTTLTELSIGATELTPAGWAQLRRFGALRTLDVGLGRPGLRTLAEVLAPNDQAAAADGVADALGTLRLTTLRFASQLTPAMFRAIAVQPHLAELELSMVPAAGFDEIARAPALRRLRVVDSAIPSCLSNERLAPLRHCKTLRSVELFVCDENGQPPFDDEAVRKLLGPDVAVHVQHTVFTVKK